ncbi:AidA/PixA family protein [Bordetella genomosp. 9]|nr:AidA/PixA family protein [Bordetella genomosp. 9]
MPNIINILAVVDAERVLQDHVPNPSAVVPLKSSGQGYGFLMTEWANTDQYQDANIFAKVAEQDQEEGGYALNVKAAAGDIVRWRMISLTSPFQYQCYLCGLDPVGGWLHITQPQPKSAAPVSAVVAPAPAPATGLAKVQTTDYWWESTVTDNLRQAYNVLFTITDSAGVQRGQFSWDPYIS